MIGWGFPASCVPVDKQVDRGTDDDVERQKPMIKAVEEDSRTPDDTVETKNSTNAAITTSTATPIDSLIRVAMRRKFRTRNAIGITPDD